MVNRVILLVRAVGLQRLMLLATGAAAAATKSHAVLFIIIIDISSSRSGSAVMLCAWLGAFCREREREI